MGGAGEAMVEGWLVARLAAASGWAAIAAAAAAPPAIAAAAGAVWLGVAGLAVRVFAARRTCADRLLL